MSRPAPGQKVLVRTDVRSGAFPDEKLVTVKTEGGPISGFTKADYVVVRKGNPYLMAEVKKVSKNTLTVRLFGSFFTTTGLADIPKSDAIPEAAG